MSLLPKPNFLVKLLPTYNHPLNSISLLGSASTFLQAQQLAERHAGGPLPWPKILELSHQCGVECYGYYIIRNTPL